MTWDDLLLRDSFKRNETVVLEQIEALLNNGVSVYPPVEGGCTRESIRRSVYKALELTPLANVRVVILGQDPYHGPGQANGLAFSVGRGVPLPPSLKNIFKELYSDWGGELRTDGDLSDWAKQGVLLLNSSLSVEEGKPGSMSELWEPVTDEIIRFIDSNVEPVVFVLWGNHAKHKKALIVHNERNVIESAHPSPLSASRGFFGSKPFSKINRLLSFNGLEPVVWNSNPLNSTPGTV